MHRSCHRRILYSLQGLGCLALYLTIPLNTLKLEPLGISQVLAQSSNARKADADTLLKQGEELRDRNQFEAALEAFQQALTIYRQTKNRPGEGRALRNIASAYYGMDAFNQATTYFQQALEIAQAINDTDLEARVLGNLGLVDLALGNIEHASEYCEKALTVARQSKNYETEALALKSLAAIYIRTDRLNKAIDFTQQALVALRKANGTPEDKLRHRKLETDLHQILGNFYSLIGVTKDQATLYKGIESYQQAVIVAKEIGDHTRQAEALSKLGEIYQRQSQYPKAIEALQQALQIFQTNKSSPFQVTKALLQLGLTYKNLAQPKQALKYFEQALNNIQTEVNNSPFDKLEQSNRQGWILWNMGEIYINISKYEQALKFYKDSEKAYQSVIDLANKYTSANQTLVSTQKKQAQDGIKVIERMMLATKKLSNFYDIASKTCFQNKNTAKTPENPQKELAEVKEELKTAQALGKPELEAVAFAQLGDAYANLKDNNRALENFKKAIELSDASKSLQFRPYIFFAFGLFYESQKEYDKAIEYYNQAVTSAQKTGNKLEEANIVKEIGITSFIANKLPEATTALYQAIHVYKSMRDEVQEDSNQICIFETQTQAYSLLQKTLIEQKRVKEALQVAEEGRATAFVKLLYSRLSTNSKTITEMPSPKLQDIQKIAKEQNATIVEYSIPHPPYNNNGDKVWDGSELYIWVVKPTGEVAFKLVKLKQNINLKDLITTTRESLGINDNTRSLFDRIVPNPGNEETQQRSLKSLYALLIKPITDFLPSNPNERVVLIPQDDLFFVPFGALQNEQGKYLIEKHTTLTSPSIQVLQLTHQQKQTLVSGNSRVATAEALVVGNPTMPSISSPGEAPHQLMSLKNAEDEAREIAQILKTKALTGNEATKSSVQQRMVNARIIHLATHGLLNDFGFGVPGAIALAPDPTTKGKQQNGNGFLTAGEIFEMKLKAELVVLSACQTGQGTLTGDGVIGLSRSLIAAGTPSVVVSLWSVNDKSTKLLMTEFYRQMQQTSDKAQALRQAMLTTMKKHPQPLNWAAFTLIGESS